MSKPVKIFELKMDDWMKGLSRQTSVAVDGLLSATSNFDPFEIAGMMQCSLAITVASNLSITSTPTILTPYQVAGSPKILVHTPTKLYQVLDGSPFTTTDKTSSVVVTNGVRGAKIWKNRYVYSLDTETRSTALDLSGDVRILTGKSSDGIYHPLCVGADKNLYEGDFSNINKYTSATGTAGNTASIIGLEDGMYVRHMVNDGRYLVILADNNPTGDYNTVANGTVPPVPIDGKYRCQILFWDMIKSTFDQIYEFSDSYLVGGAYLDGGIYIFGGDNLYVCNIVTPPKAIFNFRSGSTITEKPQNPYQIVQAKNSIYWCGQTNGRIYAYGSLFPGQKKIFYQPFAAQYTPTAITFNGSKFYVGTSGSDNFLQVSDTGSTRNTGSVTTAPIILPQPYIFHHVKVVMKDLLASGNSISIGMSSIGANEEIFSTNTQTFTQLAAKQTIVFDKHMPGGDHTSEAETFEDFQLIVSSNKAVAKVEVWAIPVDPQGQIV